MVHNNGFCLFLQTHHIIFVYTKEQDEKSEEKFTDPLTSVWSICYIYSVYNRGGMAYAKFATIILKIYTRKKIR